MFLTPWRQIPHGCEAMSAGDLRNRIACPRYLSNVSSSCFSLCHPLTERWRHGPGSANWLLNSLSFRSILCLNNDAGHTKQMLHSRQIGTWCTMSSRNVRVVCHHVPAYSPRLFTSGENRCVMRLMKEADDRKHGRSKWRGNWPANWVVGESACGEADWLTSPRLTTSGSV